VPRRKVGYRSLGRRACKPSAKAGRPPWPKSNQRSESDNITAIIGIARNTIKTRMFHAQASTILERPCKSGGKLEKEQCPHTIPACRQGGQKVLLMLGPVAGDSASE
jgi:hypothetical protein